MVLASVMLFCSACESPARPIATPSDVDLPAYHLGSGDQVHVALFSDEDLTGDYLVSESGTISLPLVGAVNVRNMTLPEAEVAVAEAIRATNVIRNPRVSIAVKQYRNFFILGEVTRPGAYPYFPGATVIRAVATAGGFTVRARRSQIELYRAGARDAGAELVGDALLQPGDVVIVPERRL